MRDGPPAHEGFIYQNMTDEWKMGKNHFINHNSGIIAFISIFKDLVKGALDEKELKNSKKFMHQMEQYLDPVFRYLKGLDQSTIATYREKSTSIAGARSLQVKLIENIIAEKPYRSKIIESHKKEIEEINPFCNKRAIELLKEKESNIFEIKGSLELDIDRYLKGDGHISLKDIIAKEGVLKTIVAFLNSQTGGTILIGAIEKEKYSSIDPTLLSEMPEIGDYYIFGIENEFDSGGEDKYGLKLLDLIKTNISDDVNNLVKIDFKTIYGKTLCEIKVDVDNSQWYYLNETEFYIRDNNRTLKLIGIKQDKFKKRYPR